jgi:MFS family permease
MTLARFAGDALRARLGAAAAVTTGGYVASCGYGLVLVSGALPGAVSTKVACALTGWVLAGIGMAVVWPVVLSTLGTAGRSAAFLSTVATISYGGGLAGPALIGTLAQALSLPLALTVPAALAVVVALAAPRLLAAAVVTAARGGSPTQGPWPPGAAGAQAAAEPSADDGQCLTAVAGAGCSVQP